MNKQETIEALRLIVSSAEDIQAELACDLASARARAEKAEKERGHLAAIVRGDGGHGPEKPEPVPDTARAEGEWKRLASRLLGGGGGFAQSRSFTEVDIDLVDLRDAVMWLRDALASRALGGK